MGRKPNRLVLEFFERGRKLEDSSNRYQHTCTLCGDEVIDRQQFPKGRVDTLMNHLMKKCPVITLEDRRRVIMQFHDLPTDLSDSFLTADNGGQNGTSNGKTVDLPFAPKPDKSALDTLAEVSYRMSDKGQSDSGKPRRRRKSSTRDAGGTHGLSAGEVFMSGEKLPGQEGSGGQDGNLIDPAEAPSGPYFLGGRQMPSFPYTPVLSLPPSSGTSAPMVGAPSPLVLAASAANELQALMPTGGTIMESDAGAPNPSLSGKHFGPIRTPVMWKNIQVIDPRLQQEGGLSLAQSEDSSSNRASSNRRRIAMSPSHLSQTHFTNDFGMGTKPSRPKVRGKFSDARRKEVQAIRKQGACLRCRMLKKVCSPGTPCDGCRGIENARLFKHPCTRAHLWEECDFYSAGLHDALFFHAIGQVRSQNHFQPVHGRIEATLHPESLPFATFKVMKGRRIGGFDIDPALLGDNGLAMEGATEILMIDSEADDIVGKLERYIRKIGPSFWAKETSPFMKPTLELAETLKGRNKDDLLSRVLDLWTVINILVDPSANWQVFMNTSAEPRKDPFDLSSLNGDGARSDGSRFSIDPVTHDDSHDVIIRQLLVAAEKHAANLAKLVMRGMELRLVELQKGNPFERFLPAVILIACVERWCWLFAKWETEVIDGPSDLSSTATQSAPAGGASVISTRSQDELAGGVAGMATDPAGVALLGQPAAGGGENLREGARELKSGEHREEFDFSSPYPSGVGTSRWPLPKPPTYYSQQCERFSDFLLMMLTMRHIPLSTAARLGDGVLVPQVLNPPAMSREWYEAIGVTDALLDQRRNAPLDLANQRCWELKYLGKFLRPVPP